MRFYSLLTVGVLSLGLYGGSDLAAKERCSAPTTQYIKRYCRCDRCEQRRSDRHRCEQRRVEQRHEDCRREEQRRCGCDRSRDCNHCHTDINVRLPGCCNPCETRVFGQVINRDRLVSLFCVHTPVPTPITIPLGEVVLSVPPCNFEITDGGLALKVIKEGLYKIDLSATFLAKILTCTPCECGIGALKVDLWVNDYVAQTFIFTPLGQYPSQVVPCEENSKVYALGGSREFIACLPHDAILRLKVAELPNSNCQQAEPQIISVKLGNPCYEGDALRIVLERIGNHPLPPPPPPPPPCPSAPPCPPCPPDDIE